jgi:hypothetical protein
VASKKRSLKTQNLQGELEALRKRGVTLPKHPAAQQRTAIGIQQALATPGQLQRDLEAASVASDVRLSAGNTVGQHESNMKAIASMRMSRGSRMPQKLGSMGDVSAAIPRFYDPMEYWDLSGLPFNMQDEGHRHKLHKWMRLYYATHPIIPTLVDIFTRFPLAGLELYSKDKKLTQFYEDLFLDNHRLNYEDFLVALGREYWLVGEVFPLGSFNETLGVWEREELLNPEDIVIERVPMMGATYLKIKPPEHMIRLVKSHSPPKEYKLLMDSMPELVPYLLRGEPFPVSDVLLKHIPFKLTDFDDHGTPILLRALRTLMHEEKLLASQDAIAERLYSPLILAKLGVQDLGGTQGPWIPGPDALEGLRDDMDIALSSDFRLLVHHFGLDISNVFGREQMPDLGNDFDRIERRLMQVFGVNPALLSGGDNAQPYASSALQAEFMSQMLSTYQRFLKEHYKARALVVAEAQEHWEYDKRGNTRVPVMEEVIEFDEDGNAYIEQRHKLMVPEMEMASLDMRDEATERQFLMALRQMGVPISDERLMVNVGFEWEDSLDELSEEAIQKTVAQQMAKLQTYKIMLQSGLPIPPDLKAEVESISAPGQPGGSQPGLPPGGGAMPPGGGPGDPNAPGQATVGVPPQGGDYVMPPVPGDISNALGGQGGPPAYTPGGPAGGPGGAPDISSERMQGMPSFSKVASEVGYDGIIQWLDERIAVCREVQVQGEVRRRERKYGKYDRYTVTAKRTVISRSEAEEKVEWDMKAQRRVIKQKLAKKHVEIPFIDEQ